MKIVFCIYNFIEEKLPLQPWLTINNFARYCDDLGYDVHIVTDSTDIVDSVLNIHTISSLRGSNSSEIYSVIDKIDPDIFVTLITPLNLATGSWVSRYKNAKIVGFSSYPFYNFLELLRAVPHVRFSDLKSYLRHLLVPDFLWRRCLHENYLCVISQSDSGAERLSRLVKSKTSIHSIPPGIDLNEWKPPEKIGKSTKTLKLLYLGTASSIRGFDVCISAYKSLSELDINLTILARGATERQEKVISSDLDQLGIAERTKLVGGWIDRDEMIAYIHSADIVVLPFILVPSELPVSVMEVIACGTPVITTNIDGLPSTVGSAGIIIKQGSVNSLKNAIIDLCNNKQKLKCLNNNCLNMSSKMYSWDVMCKKWLEKINVE